MEKVIIHSKVGEFSVSTDVLGKSVTFSWNKKNDYTTEVPLHLEGKDAFDEFKITQRNYAQHLLNAYSDLLELVEVKTEPNVIQPVEKREYKKKKEVKEHKDETNT